MAFIKNQYKNSSRSFFIFREIEEHNYSGVNIKLPFTQQEIFSCQSAEELSNLLYRPYRNKRGHVMPFIFAYMEACRIYQHEILEASPSNACCLLYNSFLVFLFIALGLKSQLIPVKNITFFPPFYKDLIIMTYTKTSFISPANLLEILNKLVELNEQELIILSDSSNLTLLVDKEKIENENNIPLLEKDIKSIIEFVKESSFFEFFRTQKNVPIVETNIEAQSHFIASVGIGSAFALADINNDQYQDYLIAEKAIYPANEKEYKGYGINPLNDHPAISDFEQALSFGWLPYSRKEELIAHANDNYLFDINEFEIVMGIIQEGRTIWELEANNPIVSRSVLQNETRKKLADES